MWQYFSQAWKRYRSPQLPERIPLIQPRCKLFIYSKLKRYQDVRPPIHEVQDGITIADCLLRENSIQSPRLGYGCGRRGCLQFFTIKV